MARSRIVSPWPPRRQPGALRRCSGLRPWGRTAELRPDRPWRRRGGAAGEGGLREGAGRVDAFERLGAGLAGEVGPEQRRGRPRGGGRAGKPRWSRIFAATAGSSMAATRLHPTAARGAVQNGKAPGTYFTLHLAHESRPSGLLRRAHRAGEWARPGASRATRRDRCRCGPEGARRCAAGPGWCDRTPSWAAICLPVSIPAAIRRAA